MQVRTNYCKPRKYGILQILAPLAQQPLNAKINSAPTIVHMYSFLHIFKTSVRFSLHLRNIRNSIMCVYMYTLKRLNSVTR